MDEWELRCKFNRGKYVRRMQRGELRVDLLQVGNAPPQAQKPAGTLSRMESWKDSANIEIARVHYYLLPGGALGASGRYDPHRIFYRGVLWHKKPAQKPPAIFDYGGRLFHVMRAFRWLRCLVLMK